MAALRAKADLCDDGEACMFGCPELKLVLDETAALRERLTRQEAVLNVARSITSIDIDEEFFPWRTQFVKLRAALDALGETSE